MPNELINLQLTELSLVKRGANQHAKAPIFKTAKGENIMSENVIKMSDEWMKKLKPYLDKGMTNDEAMKAYEAEMKSSADTLKSENDTLRKALLDNGFKVTKNGVEKKAEEEYIEVNGEKVAKSAIPAPVIKALEEAEIQKKQANINKRAESFPNIKQDVAKTLVEFDFDQDEELLNFLRAVDAMFGKAMKEDGETTVDADMESAEDKINKMAKEYAKEHKTSFEKGYEAILKTPDGRALLKDMKKGGN